MGEIWYSPPGLNNPGLATSSLLIYKKRIENCERIGLHINSVCEVEKRSFVELNIADFIHFISQFHSFHTFFFNKNLLPFSLISVRTSQEPQKKPSLSHIAHIIWSKFKVKFWNWNVKILDIKDEVRSSITILTRFFFFLIIKIFQNRLFNLHI